MIFAITISRSTTKMLDICVLTSTFHYIHLFHTECIGHLYAFQGNTKPSCLMNKFPILYSCALIYPLKQKKHFTCSKTKRYKRRGNSSLSPKSKIYRNALR